MKALPGLDTPGRIATASGLAAAIAAAMAWRFGWSATLPAYLVFAAAGATVTVSDLAARRIPNQVVASAYVLGIGLLSAACAGSGSWWPLARAVIAAVLLGAFYLGLGLAFPAGMGLGDVKWASAIGLYLGYLAWSTLPTATLLAFGTAATLVLAASLARRGRRLVVPMAPFMTAGALVAIVITTR